MTQMRRCYTAFEFRDKIPVLAIAAEICWRYNVFLLGKEAALRDVLMYAKNRFFLSEILFFCCMTDTGIGDMVIPAGT